MGLEQRVALYKQLENHRKKRLIVYVTSTRERAHALIGADAIPELLNQLEALPPDTQDDLDFLIVSNGGDATVAWRIVSLIRERVKRFSILIPQGAFSAATLIALGADQIVMHPHGNLGPTDPQINNLKKGIQFGSEDVQSFLRFAREDVGLTDQQHLRELFVKFSEEVGFSAIGVAARSAQLGRSMAEAMLQLHMKDGGNTKSKQNVRAISESLNTKYFHHGYPLNRKEAKQIGLSIEPPDTDTERLMWRIWKDIETDLKLREPFNPLGILKAEASCKNLFAPVPQLTLPPGAPPPVLQALAQQYAAQIGATMVPPAAFEYTTGIMESCRHASRARVIGSIFAARQHDLEFKIQVAPEVSGWIDVPMPVTSAAEMHRMR
jgi:hypothetical protein